MTDTYSVAMGEVMNRAEDWLKYSVQKNSLLAIPELARAYFRPDLDMHVKGAILFRIFFLLSDALKVISKFERVNFCDDTPEGYDVTDLIIKARDAMAHPFSGNNRIQTNHIFAEIHGIGQSQINGVVIENPYADDTAFCFGPLRILLKRHILRARDEAWDRLFGVKVLRTEFGISHTPLFEGRLDDALWYVEMRAGPWADKIRIVTQNQTYDASEVARMIADRDRRNDTISKV